MESMNDKWDAYFMRLARETASLSKDPPTHCGAVIVDQHRIIRGTGFNGFARGIRDDERLYDRETKLRMVIHAELNAIIHARGDLRGCTIYVWPMPPCARCAACIIQAGIIRVISIPPSDELRARWWDDLMAAGQMYREADVSFRLLENFSG